MTKNNLDELVKLAQNDVETKELNSAERFINEFIEYAPDEWTSGQAIYWKYLHWFYDNKIGKKPVYRDWFFKCMTHIPKKRTPQSGRLYRVKGDIFKLSKTEYRQMRMHLRDEKEKQKARKAKKLARKAAKLNDNETK